MDDRHPNFFASMKPMLPAPTQAQRRAQLFEMACVAAEQCFDRNGQWVLTKNSADARERIWICFGLMQGNASHIELANAILAQTRFRNQTDDPAPLDQVHPFDIFVTNHCLTMVLLHADKMTPAVKAKIESWAKVGLNTFPGNRQADLQFHGYNDNMPSKAAMGMVLGGEYFNDPAAVEHGLWSLRQLRDMLTRRGMISEFNSPTYSPITIANLTEIATLAKNPEAKQIAGQLADRVWADICGHYHTTTGSIAGPFTRAYSTDSLAQLSNLNCALWLAFGDGVFPRRFEEYRTEPTNVVWPKGDTFFFVAQDSWLSSFEWHPPAYLMEWMRNRKYPYSLVATAERAEGGDDSWGANEILATTYQQEDYAIGSSEGDWGFHADEVFVQYRRTSPAKELKDIRTGFPKYLINNYWPGRSETYRNGTTSGEIGYIEDSGRYQTVQKDNVVLACCGPVLRFAEKPVTRMGLAFILPEHLSAIDHIEYVDGHVWLQDGPFHLALRPLGSKDWGRESAVQILQAGRYRMIWMPNYEGAERTFSRKEMACSVNGMVIIAGSKHEESFDAFRKRVVGAEVLDYYHSISRTVRYKIGNLTLGMNYGLYSGRPRFVTINGKVPARPLWQADGLPAERLPFLDHQPESNSLEFPFERVQVASAPDDLGEIFSRGNNRS